MRKILDVILIVLSAVGAFFSAIFYVLFQQAKDQKELAEKELKEQNKINETIVKENKENEKELRKINSGATTDNFNSSVEFMRKLSEKGQQRNS